MPLLTLSLLAENLLGLPSHGVVSFLKVSEKEKHTFSAGGLHLRPLRLLLFLFLLLLLLFPHLAEEVTPLLSIKLFYLTPSTCSAWILPFGAQKPRSDHRLHQCC
jgi:hypothetical protein